MLGASSDAAETPVAGKVAAITSSNVRLALVACLRSIWSQLFKKRGQGKNTVVLLGLGPCFF